MVKKTNSARETLEFGRKLAKTLEGGEVVLLHGELGSGKTTFVKGLAAGLGVREEITSPTFLILRPYQGRGRLKLIHVDGYRLRSVDDARSIGLEDYIGQPDNIIAIEWPTRLKAALSKIKNQKSKLCKVKFEVVDEQTRCIIY